MVDDLRLADCDCAFCRSRARPEEYRPLADWFALGVIVFLLTAQLAVDILVFARPAAIPGVRAAILRESGHA